MNIKELRERKEKLERDMQSELSRLTKEFLEETGVDPDGIVVEMISLQEVNGQKRKFPIRVFCSMSI